MIRIITPAIIRTFLAIRLTTHSIIPAKLLITVGAVGDGGALNDTVVIVVLAAPGWETAVDFANRAIQQKCDICAVILPVLGSRVVGRSCQVPD